MRLNKYIAQAGVASRRKADELITSGKVKLNGILVTELGTLVEPTDMVEVSGKLIDPVEELVVYLMNKPPGVISASSDDRNRRTVVDFVNDSRRLFPVGRLDRDTSGAILITNDGTLTNRLIHPRYGVKKVYLAEVKGQMHKTAIESLARGQLRVEGVRYRAQVSFLEQRAKKYYYRIVLTEGKNREVKRIFQHFELPLLRLHRTSFAGLSADELPEGSIRRLKKSEIDALYALTGDKDKSKGKSKPRK
jgi:23S rRNA pseudouridine2605 synthase